MSKKKYGAVIGRPKCGKNRKYSVGQAKESIFSAYTSLHTLA